MQSWAQRPVGPPGSLCLSLGRGEAGGRGGCRPLREQREGVGWVRRG